MCFCFLAFFSPLFIDLNLTFVRPQAQTWVGDEKYFFTIGHSIVTIF